jgi:hypothetical protein
MRFEGHTSAAGTATLYGLSVTTAPWRLKGSVNCIQHMRQQGLSYGYNATTDRAIDPH